MTSKWRRIDVDAISTLLRRHVLTGRLSILRVAESDLQNYIAGELGVVSFCRYLI